MIVYNRQLIDLLKTLNDVEDELESIDFEKEEPPWKLFASLTYIQKYLAEKLSGQFSLDYDKKTELAEEKKDSGNQVAIYTLGDPTPRYATYKGKKVED